MDKTIDPSLLKDPETGLIVPVDVSDYARIVALRAKKAREDELLSRVVSLEKLVEKLMENIK